MSDYSLKEDLEQKGYFDNPDSASLERRQSARTTFKLSEEALEAKKWLSAFHDVSQKDLLDVGMNLFESGNPLDGDKELLEEVKNFHSETETIRKSQVVTVGTRDQLSSLAEEYGYPRDVLVEAIIRVLQFRTEKRIENHADALDKVRSFYERGQEIESYLKDQLASEDRFREGFGTVLRSLKTLVTETEDEIENGSPIDLSTV